MQYRLIALDVDGTLLNDGYALTETTRLAVRRAHDAGADIVLCTGRSPVNTLPILEQLGLDGVIITHNGAVTVRSEDRTVVNRYSFATEELREWVNYCRERRIHFDLCTPFELFIDADCSEEASEMYRKFMLNPVRLDDWRAVPEAPVKCTAFGNRETLDGIEADWKNRKLSLSLLRSGDLFIDLMHPQATKGNALRQLAASLGVAREEVLALGNYFNDIDMLHFAGTGIAMGNSPEGVKREADAIAPSNNEDGVAWALARYCGSAASNG